MLQKYNTYRILQLFFDYPTKHFQIREISRTLGLGLPSVRNHLKSLEGEGFVKRERKGVYESYVSTGSNLFKIYKRNDILIRLQECGLVDFLVDAFVPDTIVLFGSSSRGEDIESSDIDLFLIAKEREANLKNFEAKLRRKISLHFEEKISKTPKELLNNVINGIVVYGYLGVL